VELKKIYHPNFFELFDIKELEELYAKSSLCTYECCVIYNEKYFFELSADMGKDIEIYCDELFADYKTGEILQKAEFLKRLRAYPLQKAEFININE
jgi:hypothetical protein